MRTPAATRSADRPDPPPLPDWLTAPAGERSDDLPFLARRRPDQVMSDRAARRLCDRLVELGAIRELTGRPSFRPYGL